MPACAMPDALGAGEPERDAEYVLRDSGTGGRPCTALWGRRWLLADACPVARLAPTDVTLEDLRELDG
jgi:hypothetical protein